MIKRRVFDDENTEFVADLHPVLRRVYAARGMKSLADLPRSLEQLTPFVELKNIEEAANIIGEAVVNQQRILIIGDFDADGATSTALAVSALRDFGAKHVDYLVPNRFEYGYGLTPEIVAVAKRWEPDLIITVDNGISSIQGVEAANSHGIKVVITDHHLPAQDLPLAAAIVNPNQQGDTFPSKNLAGVGVIFYVMLAVRKNLSDRAWLDADKQPNMGKLLDLVALGTVCDVVPLDKHNRIFVYQGLQRIRAGKCRPGIIALLEMSKRQLPQLQASDLGFAVGPRLNAAGRLDDMSLGIECLLCEDIQQAREKARHLDDLNQERKAIEQDMKQQAFTVLSKMHFASGQKLPFGVCLFDKTWHQGVIGILASRIKERMHRPTIAFAPFSDTEIKGSARSIPGFHIRDALDAVASKHPGLITKFGGHAMAAGLSLEQSKFDAFAAAFDEEVRQQLTLADLKEELQTDGELLASEIDLSLAELLREGGPWGQHFPEPSFDGEFRLLQQRIVGSNHLKLVLQPANSDRIFDAICFNVDLDEWPNHRCQSVHVVYRLDVNEYQGVRKVQLMVEKLISLSASTPVNQERAVEYSALV